MKTVSTSAASRQFAALIREVSSGERVTVLARGKPVAAMVPVNPEIARQAKARQSLLQRLATEPAMGAREWTRDELHAD
jgi:prevent-host-death family protein